MVSIDLTFLTYYRLPARLEYRSVLNYSGILFLPLIKEKVCTVYTNCGKLVFGFYEGKL